MSALNLMVGSGFLASWGVGGAPTAHVTIEYRMPARLNPVTVSSISNPTRAPPRGLVLRIGPTVLPNPNTSSIGFLIV